jgi:pimeloyl-ACP methyl ester carboxylesterase
MHLGDGRAVDVVEVGDEDGRPVVWFHGSMVGNLGVESVTAIASELGQRIICAARPGYAGSDWTEPGLATVVRSTRELASRLGLSRYAVVGVSGGAPFAAAVAASAPGEVAGLGVLVGAGPPYLAQLSRDPDAVEERRLLALAATGARSEAAEGIRAIAKAWVGSVGNAGPQDMPASFRAAVLDAARSGYDGYVFDMFAFGLPWDVQVAGVTCRTYLVYGEADVTCPPAFGEWYRDQIPQAELTVVAGADHMDGSVTGRDMILARLAGH